MASAIISACMGKGESIAAIAARRGVSNDELILLRKITITGKQWIYHKNWLIVKCIPTLIAERGVIPNSVYFTNGNTIINSKSPVAWYVYDNIVYDIPHIKWLPQLVIGVTIIWKTIDSYYHTNCTHSERALQILYDALRTLVSHDIIGIGVNIAEYFVLFWSSHTGQHLNLHKQCCAHNYRAYTTNAAAAEELQYNCDKVDLTPISITMITDYTELQLDSSDFTDLASATAVVYLENIEQLDMTLLWMLIRTVKYIAIIASDFKAICRLFADWHVTDYTELIGRYSPNVPADTFPLGIFILKSYYNYIKDDDSSTDGDSRSSSSVSSVTAEDLEAQFLR
jgi:hypothetical protein